MVLRDEIRFFFIWCVYEFQWRSLRKFFTNPFSVLSTCSNYYLNATEMLFMWWQINLNCFVLKPIDGEKVFNEEDLKVFEEQDRNKESQPLKFKVSSSRRSHLSYSLRCFYYIYL